jgi:hypothetical protein
MPISFDTLIGLDLHNAVDGMFLGVRLVTDSFGPSESMTRIKASSHRLASGFCLATARRTRTKFSTVADLSRGLSTSAIVVLSASCLMFW